MSGVRGPETLLILILHYRHVASGVHCMTLRTAQDRCECFRNLLLKTWGGKLWETILNILSVDNRIRVYDDEDKILGISYKAPRAKFIKADMPMRRDWATYLPALTTRIIRIPAKLNPLGLESFVSRHVSNYMSEASKSPLKGLMTPSEPPL